MPDTNPRQEVSSNAIENGPQPPPLLNEPSGQNPPNQAARTKATGPRTTSGKKRARFNALRHGIFSGVIVLPGESRGEYESLLKELSESLLTEDSDRLEKLAIEKIAMFAWRLRRFLQAEAAEIELGMDF